MKRTTLLCLGVVTCLMASSPSFAAPYCNKNTSNTHCFGSEKSFFYTFDGKRARTDLMVFQRLNSRPACISADNNISLAYVSLRNRARDDIERIINIMNTLKASAEKNGCFRVNLRYPSVI